MLYFPFQSPSLIMLKMKIAWSWWLKLKVLLISRPNRWLLFNSCISLNERKEIIKIMNWPKQSLCTALVVVAEQNGHWPVLMYCMYCIVCYDILNSNYLIHLHNILCIEFFAQFSIYFTLYILFHVFYTLIFIPSIHCIPYTVF